MSRPHRLALLAALLIGPLAARADDRPTLILTPTATVETEPVAHEGDAADDPAIWVHPTDPGRSLVLGTDKKGGLNVFDLDGRRLQVVADGALPNNVDVLYGFPLGDEVVDLAIAGTRGKDKLGITTWRIDPATRTLAEVGTTFPVFEGGEPYGSCVYRSPRNGRAYVFVTNKAGVVEQYRIEADAARGIRPTLVRTIRVGSQVEGCVADLDLGHLYVAEEDVAIWKYSAEPDGGLARTCVARVGEHGLAADIEGMTIYAASGGRGYLIASSQGSNTFAVFDRAEGNAFVATINPREGTTGDLGETDGLDVTAAPTSPRFAAGLLVIQDGKPRAGRQNFKFFAWDDVAAGRLLVDPTRPVRPR